MTRRSAGPAFVGRAVEMRALLDAVTDARAGRGRTVCIVGEPGIGKTRLLDETAAAATEHGALCGWGVGWEGTGAPAYSPVLQACRAIARRSTDSSWCDSLTSACAALANASATSGIDPEEQRFHLFEVLSSALARAPSCVAIVVDDAHTFDAASLALLSFLARSLRAAPVLLLCGWRVEGNLDPRLASLAKEGTVVTPAPLTDSDVAELTSALLGEPRAHADVAQLAPQLARRTQGNPLFALELLALARSDPQRRLPASAPDTVRGVVAQRMATLAPESRTALEIAAVLGVDVALAPLAAVLGCTPEDALGRLDEGVRAGLLLDDGALLLRFAHPLFHEGLLAGLSPARRRALHGDAARALARMAQDGRDVAASVVAEHLLQAGPLAAHAELAEWVERAAELAMRVGAEQQAIALLERALPAFGSAPVSAADGADARARGRGRADLLVLLAEARGRSGDVAGGKESAVAAADVARALDDPERVARAALAHGVELMNAVVDRALVRLLEEALAALSEPTAPARDGAWEQHSLRARVEARLAAARQPAEDPYAPLDLARTAVTRAREHARAPHELALTLHHAAAALAVYAPPEERAPIARECVALAHKIGDRAMALRNHVRMSVDALDTGDLSSAEASASEYRRLARNASPRHRARGAMLTAMLAMVRARFADARAASDEAAASLREQPDNAMRGTWDVQRLFLLRDAGSEDELRALAQNAFMGSPQESSGGAPFEALLRAVALAWSGDDREARSLVGALPLDAVVVARFAPIMVFFASAFDTLASPEVARGYVDALRRMWRPAPGARYAPGARGWYGWGATLVYEGRTELPLALLHARLGERDEARALLRQGADAAARAGFALCALHHRVELARLEDDAAQQDATHAEAMRTGAPRLATRAKTPVAGSGAPVASAHVADVSLVRDGEAWRLTFGARSVALKDSRGVAMLARLLAHPGREISAIDLEGADVIDAGGFGPALDDDAKRAYRERMRALDTELDDAEAAHDPKRAARAQAERDALERELARALGKSGKDRKLGAASERARINVQRRVKDAIERIRETDAAAGAYLDGAVRTGNTCVFRPVP